MFYDEMKKALTPKKRSKWCTGALKFFLLLGVILSLGGGISWRREKSPPPPVVRSLAEVKPAFGQNNVSIVFGSDDNYAMYLGVCLRSLIDNAGPNSNYDVWILDGGIAEQNRKILLDFVKNRKNFSLRFFDVGPLVEKYREKLRIYNWWLTTAAYYRLFIPRIFFSYR
jgi:hypothetical protein